MWRCVRPTLAVRELTMREVNHLPANKKINNLSTDHARHYVNAAALHSRERSLRRIQHLKYVLKGKPSLRFCSSTSSGSG